MIKRREIKTTAEWLEWRRRDVTASDVAAVFGLHPYKTPLELWAEKSGIDTGKRETAVMRRGRVFEPAVKALVEIERPEWRLEKVTSYYNDTVARIGATPDFFVHGDPRGLGLLQAKTVSPKAFGRHFDEETPPFWIVLQTATEYLLTAKLEGVKWACVAAMIVDAYREPTIHIYDIPRNRAAEKKVAAGVKDFWKAADAGTQPTADYSRDAALISAMYPEETPGTEINLSGDNLVRTILDERDALIADTRPKLAQLDAIETEIKAKMGRAEVAIVGNRRITWNVQTRRETYSPASQSRVLRIGKERN